MLFTPILFKNLKDNVRFCYLLNRQNNIWRHILANSDTTALEMKGASEGHAVGNRFVVHVSFISFL